MSKFLVIWIFYAGGSSGATSGQIETGRLSDCERIEAQINAKNNMWAFCVERFE